MTSKSSFTSSESYLGLYSALSLIFSIMGFLTLLDAEQQKKNKHASIVASQGSSAFDVKIRGDNLDLKNVS